MPAVSFGQFSLSTSFKMSALKRTSKVSLSPSDNSEANAAGAPQQLCSRCARLTIEKLFDTRFRRRGHVDRLMSLERPKQRPFDTACALCCLFISVNASPVKATSESDQFYLYRIVAPPEYARDDLKVLAVARSTAELSQTRSVSFISLVAGSPEVGSLSRRLALPARRIRPTSIDFSILRGWLDCCQSEHQGVCHNYTLWSSWPKKLRVLDCTTGNLVDAPKDCKYAALSYVWGLPAEGSASDQSTSNRVHERRPQIIEDAITVTKQLGLQYLWVDRYCIDQGNETEIYSQIGQMHTIYRRAHITLVDAAGDSASSGLAGVSAKSTPRSEQRCVSVNGRQLVSLQKHPFRLVKESKWSKRAWTAQENFFSCRRIFFTAQQVYFRCRSAEFCETVNLSSSWTPEMGDVAPKILFDNPLLIFHFLEAHCGRELTYPSDALRCFQGIFKAFQSGAYPVYQYLGIPIFASDFLEAYGTHWGFSQFIGSAFFYGLCWQADRPGTRRPNFPTWTWAGWDVPIAQGSFIKSHYENEMFDFYSYDLPDPDGDLCIVGGKEYHLGPEYLRTPQKRTLSESNDLPISLKITASTVTINAEFFVSGLGDVLDFDITSRRFSGYYALFKQGTAELRVALSILSQTHTSRSLQCNDSTTNSNDSQSRGGGYAVWQPERVADLESARPIRGLVLPRFCTYGRQLSLRYFIMLIVDKGGYFERIGHVDLDHYKGNAEFEEKMVRYQNDHRGHSYVKKFILRNVRRDQNMELR